MEGCSCVCLPNSHKETAKLIGFIFLCICLINLVVCILLPSIAKYGYDVVVNYFHICAYWPDTSRVKFSLNISVLGLT